MSPDKVFCLLMLVIQALLPLVRRCASELTIAQVDRDGNRITLECRRSDGSTTVPNAAFRLNGTELSPHVVDGYTEEAGGGKVHFNISQSTEGIYGCGNSSVESSNEISLVALLEDFSDEPQQDLRVAEGIQPIILPCSYVPGALRQRYHIEWSFRRESSLFFITENAVHDQYELLENFSLQIHNASVEQSGVYQCIVDVQMTSTHVRTYHGSLLQLTVLQSVEVSPSPGSHGEDSRTSSYIAAISLLIVFILVCITVLALMGFRKYKKQNRIQLHDVEAASSPPGDDSPQSVETVLSDSNRGGIAMRLMRVPTPDESLSTLSLSQRSTIPLLEASPRALSMYGRPRSMEDITWPTQLATTEQGAAMSVSCSQDPQPETFCTEKHEGHNKSCVATSKPNQSTCITHGPLSPEGCHGDKVTPTPAIPFYIEIEESPPSEGGQRELGNGSNESPLLAGVDKDGPELSISASPGPEFDLQSTQPGSPSRTGSDSGISRNSRLQRGISELSDSDSLSKKTSLGGSSCTNPLEVVDYCEPSSDIPVPFMDPVFEIIQCTSVGGKYYNQAHDVSLKIPPGAIPPAVTLRITIGVALFGPFLFPKRSKPISPIVWLCMQEPVLDSSRFLKPVEIRLPHYLDLASRNDIKVKKLSFLKAKHDTDSGERKVHFEEAEGKVVFQPGDHFGIIHTQHFCYFCLTADPTSPCFDVSGMFYLHRVVPKPVRSSAWDVYFLVSYLLHSCNVLVRKQYPREFKITTKKFRFAGPRADQEPAIRIEFDQSPHGGWQLTLEDARTEIPLSDVDVWMRDSSQLDSLHYEDYPPKFTIEVSGEGATMQSSAHVLFTGIHTPGTPIISISLPLISQAAAHQEASLPIRWYPVPLQAPPGHGYPPLSFYRLQTPAIRGAYQGHGQHNPQEPTDEELEEVTKEATAILKGNWPVLFTYLRIPADIAAEIEELPSLRRRVFRTLYTWRSLNHGEATREKLAGLLKKADQSLSRVAEKLVKGELHGYQ